MNVLIQKTSQNIFQKQTIQKYGTVYTPETLSQYLVEKTLHYVLADSDFKKNGEISITDPACGDVQSSYLYYK